MSKPQNSASIRRQFQSARTRSDVVEAAERLLLAHGYVATSIGMIAAEANVAVQTIYNTVGNKAAVLSAVLDLTAAGRGAPALVPEIMRERVASAESARDVITILADWFVEVNERTAAINLVIAEAAVVDAGVAALEKRRAAQRLHNYGEAAAALRHRRGLRSGMSDHEAAAAIWTIGHPQVYRSLVGDIGWPIDAYREWLGFFLGSALA
ncbi:TetR/AcrR family transcriptional regulator [Glaciibacter superstes]|uniref:TetR/AcrR family transcriptional regulator n=1 Tax=Glaciibacter superstes TaxID=501023 RepID=UPI0003B56889|nr:TetR/AcrR family transcriptional regulator [Glaciibacter superstes]